MACICKCPAYPYPSGTMPIGLFLIISIGINNNYEIYCVGDKICIMQVRYLKIIEKSGYQALPWVRYITQNGGMM